jgi:hypothetical protein
MDSQSNVSTWSRIQLIVRPSGSMTGLYNTYNTVIVLVIVRFQDRSVIRLLASTERRAIEFASIRGLVRPRIARRWSDSLFWWTFPVPSEAFASACTCSGTQEGGRPLAEAAEAVVCGVARRPGTQLSPVPPSTKCHTQKQKHFRTNRVRKWNR